MVSILWLKSVTLSAVVLAAGGCNFGLQGGGSSRASEASEPALVVEAVYPGAGATVVADVIAAPIEQQVMGLEKLRHMRSRSASDGTYSLELFLERGMDVETALKLLINRVNLAVPVLPELVSRKGLTVKKAATKLLAILTLSSPDGSRDGLYLSGYAEAALRDQLSHLPGVDHIVLFGETETRWRIWPDPDKMQARGVTAADIALATEGLENRVANKTGARPTAEKVTDRQDDLNGPVGLDSLEKIEARTVKVDDGGRVIRLRDVARVEMGAGRQSYASFLGAPVVALGVYPIRNTDPRDLSSALRTELSRLKLKLPPGVRLELDIDFAPNLESPNSDSTSEYLLLDLHAPDSASMERVINGLQRCDTIVRAVEGVQGTLALSGPLFGPSSAQGSILVTLSPKRVKRPSREVVATSIRARANKEFPDMLIRLRDLSGSSPFPSCAYPIALALVDSGDRGTVALQAVADELTETLGKWPELSDVMASRTSAPRDILSIEIDRAKARTLGVPEVEITNTLQVYFGSVTFMSDPNSSPERLSLRVERGDLQRRTPVGEISRLQIRVKDGTMVPIDTVAQVRSLRGPRTVERYDGQPMLEITANINSNHTLAEARLRCELKVKDLNLPGGYQLNWLTELSRVK
jgi:multidrug efflux pump subunit AcrB